MTSDVTSGDEKKKLFPNVSAKYFLMIFKRRLEDLGFSTKN